MSASAPAALSASVNAVAIRRRLQIAINECQNYRTRLQNTFDYIDSVEKINKGLAQQLDLSELEKKQHIERNVLLRDLLKEKASTNVRTKTEAVSNTTSEIEDATAKLELELEISSLKREIEKQSTLADDGTRIHDAAANDADAEYTAIDKPHKDAVNKRILDLEKDLRRKDKELAKMRSLARTMTEEKKELVAQLDGFMNSRPYETEINQLNQRLTKLSLDLERQREESERLKKIVADANEKTAASNEQERQMMKTMKEMREQCMREMNELRDAESVLKENEERSRMQIERLQARHDTLVAEKERDRVENEHRLKQHQQRVHELTQQIIEFEIAVADQSRLREQEISDKNELEKQLRAEIDTLRLAKNDAEQQLETARGHGGQVEPHEEMKTSLLHSNSSPNPADDASTEPIIDQKQKTHVQGCGDDSVADLGGEPDMNAAESMSGDSGGGSGSGSRHSNRRSWGKRTIHDIFDYMATHLLKGNLTEEAFLSILLKQDPTHTSITLKQLFRVLKLYQRVLEMAHGMSRIVENSEAIELIVKTTKDAISCNDVRLYSVVKQPLACLECKLSSTNDDAIGRQLPIEGSIPGACIASKQLDIINDVKTDPRHDFNFDAEFGADATSLMCSPIPGEDGEPMAVLVCNSKSSPDGFNETDNLVLQQITKQASIILQTVRKFQAEVKQKQRTQALLEIVKAVSRNDDIDDIIKRVIETSYRVLRCDRVTLFMVDTFTNELWFKVSKDAQGFRLPVGQGVAGHVAATGEVLNIPNAYEDARFNSTMDKKTGYRTSTILCMPICDHRGNPVAVMQAINKFCTLCEDKQCRKHSVKFDHDDVEIMQAFARETASALQRKSLESAFEQALGMDKSDSDMRDYISQFMGSSSGGGGNSGNSGGNSGGNNNNKDLTSTNENLLSTSSDIIDWSVAQFSVNFSHLASWDFDYFEECKNEHEVMSLIERVFEDLNLLETFKIPRETLRTFIIEIRKRYRDNPYHNFMHAFSVLHMTYLMLTTTEANTKLTMLDVLVLVIGALGHDIEHPGTNNDFLINTGSKLALRYNDRSVLENHHSAVTNAVLHLAGCDLLAFLSPQQRKEARRIIIEVILHTDMTNHADVVKGLQLKIQSHPNPTSAFERDEPDDRNLLCNALLHCSDIGNPLLPTNMSLKWARLIQEEFCAQAMTEKEQGLPYAEFMAKRDFVSLANLQINFINYVVNPIWSILYEMFPGASPGMKHMLENKLSWEKIKNDASAAAAAATATAAAPVEDDDDESSETTSDV